jgi:indolepyruvate ferredoxin oxidoreductase
MPDAVVTPSSLAPYEASSGRVFVSGIEALVRLLLVQRRRDRQAGLTTAGFVSGYRGSPLGGLDEALWHAAPVLEREGIKFLPGINEELAATAVWGTQQVHLTGDSAFDGVFALWYGKSPGVDRCGDVFKHMSHAGTSPRGGILIVAGDDHGAYSSTLPNQSEPILSACSIPVLFPGSVAEYVELGLHGFAMSRFAGLPVAFKALADTVESSGPVDADIDTPEVRLPSFDRPASGLHSRVYTTPLGAQARAQEALMQDFKLEAAKAYARENRLNRTTLESAGAKLGIVAAGKSYQDVMEALRQLGVHDDPALRDVLRVFKVAMPWPLEPRSLLQFAHGLEEILVVEEKRGLIEPQIKEMLYGWKDAVRPRVVGKSDDSGHAWHGRGSRLLSPLADLSVAQVERVIADRLAQWVSTPSIRQRLLDVEAAHARVQAAASVPARPAWYCAGCPHNTSTRVPDGSVALAGIGCHVMATAIYPEHNRTATHMGGEGATWLGQTWFSKQAHVFANLGDGTYFHSGSLAIRAAVAARVPITYKILYNDAVAMTGGQPVDGPIGVPEIVRQLAAEGVRRIALVADDPSRWRGDRAPRSDVAGFALSVHGRQQLDAVQRELREYRGVSVLIYDQVCAAEKRRRSRVKKPATAPVRAFINEAVCEGCGDCGVQSNCTALMPVHGPQGIKRQVDQSACNTDLSCVRGECPSFVTVHGGTPRRPKAVPTDNLTDGGLPMPAAAFDQRRPVHNILITGIGGTGVITVGAVLGRAASLEGRPVSVLDMTGMSQKNGAVSSHVRISTAGQPLHAQRIPACDTDLLLACDMLTAGAPEHLLRLKPGLSTAVLNSHEQPTGHFAQDREWRFPAQTLGASIEKGTQSRVHAIDASAMALRLTGDAMGANLLLLGFAVQKGLVPLTVAAITQAIRELGVAVTLSLAAFTSGRRIAVDGDAAPITSVPTQVVAMPRTLRALLHERCADLTAYQDARYAARYRAFVLMVDAEQRRRGLDERLARVVADNLFRLMAYKDEYEVARLFVQSDFRQQVTRAFEGQFHLRFWMAPPLWSRRDAQGRPVKASYGPWMWHAMRALATLRRLRGTRFDPFGYSRERRNERTLIDEYCMMVRQLQRHGTDMDQDTALRLAALPEQIKGFGTVKERAIRSVREQWSSASLATASNVPEVGAPAHVGKLRPAA